MDNKTVVYSKNDLCHIYFDGCSDWNSADFAWITPAALHRFTWDETGYRTTSGLPYLIVNFLKIRKRFSDVRQIASIGWLYSVDINRLYIARINVENICFQ